jgi:hypothetical protein
MVRLTDNQLHEVQAAAQMVPWHLRADFLERVAAKLHGQDLGDGLVHRIAYEVARTMIWETEQTAFG